MEISPKKRFESLPENLPKRNKDNMKSFFYKISIHLNQKHSALANKDPKSGYNIEDFS